MIKLNFTNYPNLVDLQDSLERYVNHGVPCGGFLNAVLENDFMESFVRADYQNKKRIESIAMFFYNEIPAGARGSREVVEGWIDSGGYIGITKDKK